MTLGVLGGTFDPIHLGHLAAGDAAQHALSLDSVLLVPSRIPPHRATRFVMVMTSTLQGAFPGPD